MNTWRFPHISSIPGCYDIYLPTYCGLHPQEIKFPLCGKALNSWNLSGLHHTAEDLQESLILHWCLALVGGGGWSPEACSRGERGAHTQRGLLAFLMLISTITCITLSISLRIKPVSTAHDTWQCSCCWGLHCLLNFSRMWHRQLSIVFSPEMTHTRLSKDRLLYWHAW